MHLHLNPVGGLAGDMVCAALLDLQPDLIDPLRATIAALGLGVAVRIRLESAGEPLSGRRFIVEAVQGTDDAQDHHHHHHHDHTGYRDICRLLDAADLDERVRVLAHAIFARLATAEAQVHGVALDDVSFHEVGHWDSVTDIVGAAFLLQQLGVETVSCGPVPLGAGTVRTAHGLLPVPTPATALLLRGQPLVDDGVGGERVTPTGAAILRALSPLPMMPAVGTLIGVGRGFGTRHLPGIPNCIQVLLLETAVGPQPNPMDSDQVLVLTFDIDDQTPEDFAVATDHLREVAGVLCVTSTQVVGKQGRPSFRVEILASVDHFVAITDACFRETPSLGLRWQVQSRVLLKREARQVEVDGRRLGVKLARRAHGITAKTENRDVAHLSAYAQREALRQAAVAQALNGEPGNA